jgi:hypothetical protein
MNSPTLFLLVNGISPEAKSSIYSTAIGIGMDIRTAIIIVASPTPRMAPFLIKYPLEATKIHISDTIFSTH